MRTDLKRLYLILLCILAQQGLQASVTDSLQRLLPSLEGEEKAEALVDLYLTYYRQGNIDSSLLTLDELITLRQEQDSVEKEGNARWSRIAILNNSARSEELANEAVKQMPWFLQHGLLDRYYQVWQRKCSAFHDNGKVQTSLREAQLMHDDAVKRGNLVGQAMAYKQMGLVYFDLHQFEQASEVFRQGIDLLVQAKDSVGMLSGVYDFQCKTLQELKRYDEVLAIVDVWQKYLEGISKRQGERVIKGPYCSLYLAEALALLSLHRQDEAEKCVLKAEQSNNVYPTKLASYYIYLLHMEVSLAQNKVDRALEYVDSVAQLGEVFDNRFTELKAQAYIKSGRAEEAANLYQKLYHEHDSIYSREMRMQLDELNTLFKVDELKMQNQLSRQKSLIIAIVIVALALLILIHYRVFASRKMKREHQLLLESNEKLELSYKELKAAQARAEESSRMKTNFIQQISHEIRTPLNVLSGFTQVITTPGIELDEATKADANQRITENTERITGLVNKMLELSEASSQTVIERCDHDILAEQIALQAVEASRISSDPNIVFTMDIDSDTEAVKLNTNLRYATRALELLLDNARKFTKEGAVCLRVEVENITELSNNPIVSFIVEDTGIGVPSEEAEHIFDEFVQLDEYYEGTGIGLAVARSIARRLGGDIVLDTKYEGGARFVYTLPLS